VAGWMAWAAVEVEVLDRLRAENLVGPVGGFGPEDRGACPVGDR
jgi:hypothetical protein